MRDRLYNSNLKMEFIDSQELDDSTKKTIAYEFLKVKATEEKLDKDVYAFNDVEFANALRTMRSSSVLSIRKTLSIFNSYVKWCIVNGKRGKYENNINYVDIFIRTESDFSKFVSNRQLSSKILTKEELDDLINALVNPSDQVVIQSMYEFIGGQKLYELRSLTIDSVDDEACTVDLIDMDGSIRTQEISRKLVELMKDSHEVKEYIFKNGEMDKNGNISSREFIDSRLILKLTRYLDSEFMTYSAMFGKIRRIREYTGYSHITITSLRETRVIHEIIDVAENMKKIIADKEVFEEAFNRIYKQYGVKLSHMQRYSIREKYNQLIDIKEF